MVPAMHAFMRRAQRRLWQRLETAAEQEVDRLLQALPPPLRDKARQVPIVFLPEPTPEMVREGVDAELLGLFTGEPYASAAHATAPEITLFLGNLWEESGHDAGAFREQVRRTLLHELGHYLGFEEEDLAGRDLD